MTMKEKLADSIATLKDGIDTATKSLKADKAKLIEIVGDEGETIERPLATITVTKRTQDRSSGNVNYGLDLEKFLELDAHIQANLIKKGIVTESVGQISGQAPTVKVKMK